MYAKIFSQIYDGTLCTKGPWQALVTFQQLLVLADQDGNVDMTAGAIARRTTIPLEIIQTGIEVLMQPDPESRTPTQEGRRIVPLAEDRAWGWHIVNYASYRQLKREQDRREYHKSYYQKRRLKNSTQSQQFQQFQHVQPIAKAKAKAKAEEDEKRRGTRLPSNWTPGGADIQYCKMTRPDLDPHRVADDFRDYWVAIPGSKGVKLDWSATWRSWVRKQFVDKGTAYSSHMSQVASELAPGIARKQTQQPTTLEICDVTLIAGNRSPL